MKQSLKKNFLQIVVFGSLVPLFVSFLFLYFVIKVNKEKIASYNENEVKKIELSVQHSFTRIADSLHKISGSSEIKNLLNATFQNELSTQKHFREFLEKEKTSIKNSDISYCVYGSQGNVLYAEKLCTENKEKREGIHFVDSGNFYAFNTRAFSASPNNSVTLSAILPFDSLKKYYPLLKSFAVIPASNSNITSGVIPRLDRGIQESTKFKANLGNEDFNFKILFLFYAAIFICSIISLFSIIYGVRVAYTLRKKAEESFKLAAMGKVAHLLAHDIQKPFQNIKNFANELSLAKTNAELDELVKQTQSSIHSSQLFIQNLLQELIDANTQTLHVKNKLCLNEIIDDCFESLPKQSQNNIKIELVLNHTLPLQGDDLKLKRAFYNIISNAFDAVRNIENAKIKIESFDDGHNVRIEFYNSHSFISKDDIKNIFDPFYTKKESGTGLGLAIAKKMVELHGGKISCTSKKNDGVNFIITLPSVMPNPTPNSEPTTKHIFMIDDCPLTLRSWERTLKPKHKNSPIHAFSNFEDFFHFVEKNNIKETDIQNIICDYIFPNSKISVPNALQKIKKFYSKSVYIATNMQASLVQNNLKKMNVIIVPKDLNF